MLTGLLGSRLHISSAIAKGLATHTTLQHTDCTSSLFLIPLQAWEKAKVIQTEIMLLSNDVYHQAKFKKNWLVNVSTQANAQGVNLEIL